MSERPDFDRIARRVTPSGASWRSQDWQQTQADTLALIAYAATLEGELAAARRAMKSARHSLELIRDTGGSSADRCEAEMALKMMYAALARGGATT